MDDPPSDWPEQLCPGSLNVLIDDDGYPPDFWDRCNGTGVKKLDSQCFRPAYVIPRECIKNNKLKATPELPVRGDAQIWRAELRSVRHSTAAHCWLMRRFGSGLGKQLELVADVKLRDKLGLQERDAVEVIVEGIWAGS